MNPFKRFWRSPPKNEPVYHPVRTEALVVEDDPAQADMLCGLLRMQGALTTRAYNIAAALEVLNSKAQFQVAFIDLGLPNGSGSEVVRLIRERRRGTHCVIVSGSPEKIMLAASHGLVSVMQKPYSINSIREVLTMMRLPHAD